MTDEKTQASHWGEADSRLFIDEGRYYVPERELQIDSICALIPPLDGGLVVELCCGEGLLTQAILERFPDGRMLAFDGSPTMLESTAALAGEHGGRLETRRFDLAATAWREFSEAPRAVISSLAIHHLDDGEKRRLYQDVAAALAPGGVFVVADIIAPADARGLALAARSWDDEVKCRALELDGDLAAFERFAADDWNLFADPEPDPVDKPSRLFDQLVWLRDAGLMAVDVYWMKADHAIFGGRKQDAGVAS
jgi:tRNA (cmo5U34)-methyltransferase